MANETSNALIDDAKCFKCIPPGLQPQVQTYLLDQIRNTLSVGWEDLVFPVSVLDPPGAATGGTLVATSNPGGNQLALEIDDGLPAESFWVAVQMPHTWIAGTPVYPHIHVCPQSNNQNTLAWTLDYSIAALHGTFPVPTTVAAIPAVIPANSQYQHLDFNLPATGIDMSAFLTPSTILRLKYTLTSATEAIHIVSFDVHYLKAVSPVAFDPLTD